MPQLEIELQGPLMVGGGRAVSLGVDLTTARRFHAGLWVPYIPGTALRGAIRQQLEALLSGAGESVATPYPFDGPQAGSGPDDLVARLFGYSGPTGSRSGAREGELRFADAMPDDPSRASQLLAVRPGVSIDDHRASAEDRKLFFREVAEAPAGSLRFVAELSLGDVAEEDLRLLKAAVATTTALGAAKASGGGQICIHWREDREGSTTRVSGEPTGAKRAVLRLRLHEPAHYGDGGPLGNYRGTRTYIPGATLRGAIAWALIRHGVSPQSDAFRALFLDEAAPVSFGDGLAMTPEGAEPQVIPVTRRRLRGAGNEIVDLLPTDLARARLNRALAERGGAHFQPEAGDRKLDPLPTRPAPGLLRRVRTRVSIDRHTGTAAEGRLFSIEQIESWGLEVDANGHTRSAPVTFLSTVEGLNPEAARLLARLDGVSLLVGGRRNHGLGRVEAEVAFLDDTNVQTDSAVARSDTLTETVHQAAVELAHRAGVEVPEPNDRLLLALTATSDFVPEESADHPLRALAPQVGLPQRCFLTPGFSGGYDQRQNGQGGEPEEPLKTLHPAVGAGSVYVYSVDRGSLPALLDLILPALALGVGQRRHSGCGRFEVFRPLETAT